MYAYCDLRLTSPSNAIPIRRRSGILGFDSLFLWGVFLQTARRLIDGNRLSVDEFEYLILNQEPELLASAALEAKKACYGDRIFIRGLIEVTNFCKNDCHYCGIRNGNKFCERYRLSNEEILTCCENGYHAGFRTFVLQGGEDADFSDQRLCDLVSTIKELFPDCAVTLSLGERSHESYLRLYEAGADRYLLRHETATKAHYERLHPQTLSFENRMRCLRDLKQIGYQVGCGFMVGSPWQTTRELAQDLYFVQEFDPDMCGIGPFVPHCRTRFANEKAGSVELTCYLLSILRLIKPNLLLPATTALGTLDPEGREKGILSGANVVMPNISPVTARKKYMLYDNKLSDSHEAIEGLAELKNRMERIGCRIVTDRGDIKK